MVPPGRGVDGSAAQTSAKASARRGSLPEAEKARGDGEGKVIYPRGPIAGVPEDMERISRRKKMFLELDELQQGWSVELVMKGEEELVEAVFYAPDGTAVGAFNKARRLALSNSKAG